jgi:hypothetical protein
LACNAYAYAIRRLSARLSATVLGGGRWPVLSRITERERGREMKLDEVLDSIENIINLHPAPVKQEHCKYCSAWLLIVEDILGNGEGK